MTSDWDGVAELFRSLVARGEVCVGGQLYVEEEGEVRVDCSTGVDGLRSPVEPDSIHAAYCSLKPVLALLVADQVERGELSFTDELRWLVPRLANQPCAEVTVGQLLNHTAGLTRPQGIAAELLTDDQRRAQAEQSPPSSGFVAGHHGAYSEFAGWHLLGVALSDLGLGEDLGSQLRERVIAPLGLDDHIVLGATKQRWDQVRSRLRVNADMRGAEPTPLLLERTPRYALARNYGYGGYASATGLGRLYSAILARLRDKSAGALPSGELLGTMTTTSRHLPDISLGRPASFGYGFMTGLTSHGLPGGVAGRAFGHTGNVGTSVGMCDPDTGVTAGIVLNGLTTQSPLAEVAGWIFDGASGTDGLPGE
jgi:CubicO group peptidase (beta-lactamase class C family)